VSQGQSTDRAWDALEARILQCRRCPRLVAWREEVARIAFEGVLRVYRDHLGHDVPRLHFAHGAVYPLGEGWPVLVASYHPSRQNTQTGRLTREMFADIWTQVRRLLEAGET